MFKYRVYNQNHKMMVVTSNFNTACGVYFRAMAGQRIASMAITHPNGDVEVWESGSAADV